MWEPHTLQWYVCHISAPSNLLVILNKQGDQKVSPKQSRKSPSIFKSCTPIAMCSSWNFTVAFGYYNFNFYFLRFFPTTYFSISFCTLSALENTPCKGLKKMPHQIFSPYKSIIWVSFAGISQSIDLGIRWAPDWHGIFGYMDSFTFRENCGGTEINELDMKDQLLYWNLRKKLSWFCPGIRK